MYGALVRRPAELRGRNMSKEVAVRAAISSPILATFLLIPAPIQSQQPITRPAPPLQPQAVGQPREIIIYRDRNFDGPAVAIPRDEPNLRLVWTVNSVRVRGGTWQLCERANFQGSCLTVSESQSNLGHRRVQSARMTRERAWREVNTTDVSRVGWTHRVIRVPGTPRVHEVRLCAERNRIRLHDARARFSNNRFQTLHLPSQLASGRCTNAIRLASAPRNLSSVEVTASTTQVAVRGRIRLEVR